jgi:hypothetical protein
VQELWTYTTTTSLICMNFLKDLSHRKETFN